MTTNLRETLEERAGRLDAPTLDLSALLAEGERRARRSRRRIALAGAGGLAALAVVAALVVPGQDEGTGRLDGPATGQDTTQPLAWVLGSTLHVGAGADARTVDLGRPAAVLQQGRSGFVFSDAAGEVYAVVGEEVTRVGRLARPSAARFASDGDVVAWVDAGNGTPAFAALDLSAGSGVVTLPVEGVDATILASEASVRAAIAAVDRDTVYLRNPEGAAAWRPFVAADALEPLPWPSSPRAAGSGSTGTALPPGIRVVLEDVKAGVFHYQRTSGPPSDRKQAYVVGPDLASGVTLDSRDGILSPDGRYLVSETAEENRVLETATGTRMPFDPDGRSFVAGYRWLDGDTYAALSVPDGDAVALDLLRCEATTGTCSTEVEGAPLDGPLVLPLGEPW